MTRVTNIASASAEQKYGCVSKCVQGLLLKKKKKYLTLVQFYNSQWRSNSLVLVTGGQRFKWKLSPLHSRYRCIIFENLGVKLSLKNVKFKAIPWWEVYTINCGRLILAKSLTKETFGSGLWWWVKVKICIWGMCTDVKVTGQTLTS